jgi:HAMP domain-containing protein
LSTEAIRDASRFRGTVDLPWNVISATTRRPDISPAIAAAIAKVDADYFRTYDETRNAVFKAGDSGTYPLSGDDFFARVTAAIDTMLRLAEAVGGAADAEATNDAAHSTATLWVNGGVLLAALALVMVSLWVMFVRILRPLAELADALRHRAAVDLSIKLPGLERTDEIGEMAHAVEDCKLNAETKAREDSLFLRRSGAVGVGARQERILGSVLRGVVTPPRQCVSSRRPDPIRNRALAHQGETDLYADGTLKCHSGSRSKSFFQSGSVAQPPVPTRNEGEMFSVAR